MGSMKVLGIVLGSIGLVALLLVLIVSVALPTGFFLGAKDAEQEYDDWLEGAEEGDKITVSGKIAEKEENTSLSAYVGKTVYLYKFEGCDSGFSSSEDIGDKGDTAIVTIEFTILPEAEKSYKGIVGWGPPLCCGVLSLILLIVGIVLLVLGLSKKKKEAASPPVPPPQ